MEDGRARLLVFSDYVCPYCALAEAELAPLRGAAGVAVDAAAFELRPPGTALLTAESEWMRRAWSATVEPLMRASGVELRYPERVPRTRKAHEAAAWARAHEPERAPALHAALFDAYWREGRDIGRIDVLVELGAAVGLDATGLKVALDIDQCTSRVEEDERLAERLGLAAVPAYVLQRAERTGLRVGLQRETDLRDWLGT